MVEKVRREKEKAVKVSLVQFCVGPNPAENADALEALIRETAAADAPQLVLTPEASNVIQPDREVMMAQALPLEQDPVFAMGQRLAAELSVFLCLGSVLVAGEIPGSMVNRQILFSPMGEVVNSYDKIHLFDVEIGDGQHYGESEIFTPGKEALLSALPNTPAVLGHTICYDLRFPALHQALAMAGANVLLIPAAFTQTTGRAHWHVLLRARAIETSCWVLAAGTCGEHAGERRTYGHSCVVSPWGEIVAELASETEPGILAFDLDFEKVGAARKAIPALDHARTFHLSSSH